jgi:hypothetical protein
VSVIQNSNLRPGEALCLNDQVNCFALSVLTAGSCLHVLSNLQAAFCVGTIRYHLLWWELWQWTAIFPETPAPPGMHYLKFFSLFTLLFKLEKISFDRTSQHDSSTFSTSPFRPLQSLLIVWASGWPNKSMTRFHSCQIHWICAHTEGIGYTTLH